MANIFLKTGDGWVPVPLPAPVHKISVWHYTTIDAFVGILNSSELWATEFVNLNDSAELAYGLGKINQTWLERRDETVSWSNEVREFVERVVATSQEIAPRSKLFVLSATERCDDLSQWRAYADGQVAIGLATSALLAPIRSSDSQAALDPFPHLMSSSWRRVIYDTDEQEAYAWRMIRHITHLAPDSGGGEMGTTDEMYAVNHALTYLRSLAAYMKGPGWADEREVRFVTTSTGCDAPVERSKVRDDGIWARYIALGAVYGTPNSPTITAQGPLPLSGVAVGKAVPRAQHHLIEEYLEATGHVTVPLHPSTLSVRANSFTPCDLAPLRTHS